MASSADAFSRLVKWKKSNTVLNLTVLTRNEPPLHVRGVISVALEDTSEVYFVELPSRDGFGLDLSGAEFTVGKRSVEARRSDADVVSFVEAGTATLRRGERVN